MGQTNTVVIVAYFLLEFYTMAISGQRPTSNSAHSWGFHSVAPVGSLVPFPSQLHFPDVEVTSPCPMLIKLNPKLGGAKYQFCKPPVGLRQN